MSNIFEISEIFEVQSESKRILKFKVQICSDLEFRVFEKFKSERISNVSNILDNLASGMKVAYQ